MAEREIGDAAVARSAMAKASWRILPLIGLGYLVSFMDRVNIAFAAPQMNRDLGFSATVYGLGAGLFFLSYALLEIPSNLLLVRFGARRWLSRIMISWGLISAGMMFVQTPMQFYGMRLLLGVAEAGFFPGLIFYLSHWFPLAYRGRAISRFYCTGSVAAVIMGGLAGWLLSLDGLGGLRGWQWLLLLEGLPAVVLGVIVLRWLPDAPQTARWLTAPEKAWIAGELAREAERTRGPERHVLAALRDPLVLQLGLIGFLTIGGYLAFALSVPTLLAGATGLDATRVGYVVALGGVLGVAFSLFTGWHSDRRGDRFVYLLGSVAVVGAAWLVMGLTHSPAIVIAAYLVLSTAWSGVSLSTWTLATDVLDVRALAVGSAAINSISQLGAFLLPYLWGVARDATGSYRAGLLAISALFLVSVMLILIVRRQVRGGHPAASRAGLAEVEPD